ncbi:allantoinase AllB [Chitinophaga agrisoli]|uniref:allantoinase n=1 Tax=Chitinophaga agrisoli TaxID=2607653 RepID=A0A5B2VNV1_9BACT|nr:allantoinase AllB [Chitinophaga agrisoli]KAA2241363.1 allantoinase AllB [Chitinophaga agrisoli]
MFDLAIRGKNIITPAGLQQAVVLIKDGRIADVLTMRNDSWSATSTIETGDSIVMPGITDPHVHINEPGRTEWEGFETATKAAIAGGITTLVDMPLNASPVTTTVSAFKKKLAAAAPQLHTHCGFWGGIVPGNEKEAPGLMAAGVLGFKAFLTHSGIDDFPNVSAADLEKVMPLIAAQGLPLLVHCELTDSDVPAVTDARSYQQYLASRPERWENEAIALMIRLCGQFNCRVHIVHLSSACALAQIRQAKEKGLPLTVETAQHYLYFQADTIPDGQTLFKCAPPIRNGHNNDQLWSALQEGLIDFVATDHSPATPALKQIESGDLSKAWGGISSLQLALPVLWTAARARSIPLTQIARWLCEAPARLPGLAQQKGKIAKGYDADLVVWDPEAFFPVTAADLYHKHKTTPYLLETLYGVVQQTYLGGEKVYDNGAFTAPHLGKIITR